ncbi:hypothetical protein C0991_005158 [Blastosporella zonata]|nr:hypothetical protein C0991_005158 [Blastosporella zonata]
MSTKSPDFWLRDGSIVLSVEKTLFRVHQTILANHSEIFSDIFSLPQPPHEPGSKDSTRIEGCLIVELQDKAKDVLDLLKAIYHPSHFEKLSITADLDTVLNFIGGILRLSTKYVIHELRRRCISILTARFPSSYEDYLASGQRHYIPSISAVQDDSVLDWSNITTFSLVSSTSPPTNGSTTTLYHIQPQPSTSQYGTSFATHQSRSRRHSDYIHHRDRDHLRSFKDEHRPKPKLSSIMRAITLANETNVLTILPYAYYLLARTSEPHRLLVNSSGSLSWYQKAIALVGRSHLETAEITRSHSFLASFAPAPTCMLPSTCSGVRGPLLEWALLCTKGRAGPEPLRLWDRWERLGLCPVCVKHAMMRHERGRKEVWEMLPSYFELGTWSELKERQEV